MPLWLIVALVVLGLVLALIVHDLTQRKHAILRNFPLVGHFRYLLEAIGPELRQYIVTGNDEERPFSRDQRAWVYRTAQGNSGYVGFGTDNNLERPSNDVLVKHVAFPLAVAPGTVPTPAHGTTALPAAKVLGAGHGRAGAFRPASVVNISAMSFGSLSREAVETLNRGAALAGCLHNTGEGSISPHHRHGGDLIWQIGTGYFGCRTADGDFDLELLAERARTAPVRAIEIKLSQGAKPSLGGVLPAVKVTPEIAEIRGIRPGEDCISPPYHRAFHDINGLITFVEQIAQRTGLPVGIKSAVGETAFWHELAARMAATGGGPDFVTIDGAEGGTAAAPLVFSDHVALPFMIGFTRVYRAFAEHDLHHDTVFAGAGKLGLPENALLAMALGCDLINVGREALLALGCIQAQRCHSGRCPVGVATQSARRGRALDPRLRSLRVANYLDALRRELVRLARATGVDHPAQVSSDMIEILEDRYTARTATEVFGWDPRWGLPRPPDEAALLAAMRG
jgi:glutamate synthase domain-containing protein 2